MVRAEAQPRGEVFHGRPAMHIQTNLAEDDQGCRLVKALDLSQVHPRDPVEGFPDGESWLVAAPLARTWGRGQRLALTAVGKRLQIRLDMPIAFGDFLGVSHLLHTWRPSHLR